MTTNPQANPNTRPHVFQKGFLVPFNGAAAAPVNTAGGVLPLGELGIIVVGVPGITLLLLTTGGTAEVCRDVGVTGWTGETGDGGATALSGVGEGGGKGWGCVEAEGTSSAESSWLNWIELTTAATEDGSGGGRGGSAGAAGL